MRLTPEQKKTIVTEAISLLGKKWEIGFSCVDFVRRVYASVGIIIPKIVRNMNPPKEFNITRRQISNPPVGRLIFFRRKDEESERKWTHVGILLSEKRVIHCSQTFGEKVAISDLDEILIHYDFVQ